jgi:hypothetical protein
MINDQQTRQHKRVLGQHAADIAVMPVSACRRRSPNRRSRRSRSFCGHATAPARGVHYDSRNRGIHH